MTVHISRVTLTTVGLLLGILLFLVIEPAMAGQRQTAFVDRPWMLFEAFRFIPFVVFPVVCVITFLISGESSHGRFLQAFWFACCLLIPVPLVGTFVQYPQRYGVARLSGVAGRDIAVVVAYLLVLSATVAAAGVCVRTVLKPLIVRLSRM